MKAKREYVTITLTRKQAEAVCWEMERPATSGENEASYRRTCRQIVARFDAVLLGRRGGTPGKGAGHHD